MALHLVTGYNGSPHVTSADQGALNAGCVGLGEYVLGTGDRFNAEVVSANTVRIHGGDLVMQGRHVRLDTFVDCPVSNGASGMVRNDIIVVQYDKEASTGIETVQFVVIKGNAVASSPSDPTWYPANIFEGANMAQMPLYRIRMVGMTIERIEPLFKMLAPIAEMQKGTNLIINSDFRCNQRKSTSWSVTNTATYTVDMWRAFQVKVETSTNGIKVAGQTTGTQGYFTQFVHVDDLSSQYTICIRADGKVYSFTTALSGTAVEKVFDSFKITALYLSANKQIKINYCPLNTTFVTIGYIDLFEGIYAYPHVREDYTTAMARCKQYLKKESYICPIVRSYPHATAGTYAYKVAIPHGEMRDTPQVEIVSFKYTNSAGTEMTLSPHPSDSLGVAGAYMSHAQTSYSQPKHADCYAIEVSCIISCEPNES